MLVYKKNNNASIEVYYFTRGALNKINNFQYAFVND
jgi:hypothetical protein